MDADAGDVNGFAVFVHLQGKYLITLRWKPKTWEYFISDGCP